jgi:glycosyltransferase involved in cell wall biosynthesis
VATPGAALISFRLGGSDGVSVEAAKWGRALGVLGFDVRTVAGAGPVDHLLPGLAIDAPDPPTDAEIDDALKAADLVVVENLCSLPLNPPAAAGVARVLRDRRALMHHHDLPWQRERFATWPPPPDDPQWVHVTVNDLSRRQLRQRGIPATVVRNTFEPDPPAGDRRRTRDRLGVAPHERLLLQPTRAIARKNVGGGLALAAGIAATYWLLGPAEDGYAPELERLLQTAAVRVVHGHGGDGGHRGERGGDGDAGAGGGGIEVVDAYAACDAVVLPSTSEGFGNPAVEAAVHDRPLAIGSYPVADELRAFGFRWFDHDDPRALGAWLDDPEMSMLEHNHEVARRHFSSRHLPDRLARVLARAGGKPWPP